MIRKAFYMEVRPGKLGEYTHLFGYLEIASEAEFEKIASYECCHKWWKLMTRYLVTDSPDSAKAKEEPMDEVFYLN